MSISSVNSNFPTSKFVGKVLTKKLTLQHNSPLAVTSLYYTSVDKPFFYYQFVSCYLEKLRTRNINFLSSHIPCG